MCVFNFDLVLETVLDFNQLSFPNIFMKKQMGRQEEWLNSEHYILVV